MEDDESTDLNEKLLPPMTVTRTGEMVEEECVQIGNQRYSLPDIIGVKAMSESTVEVWLCHKKGSGRCCSGGGDEAGARVLTKEVVESPASVIESVQSAMREAYPCSPRRVLVIVNPASGVGGGMRIYKKKVKPVLEAAGIDIELLVTEKVGDAKRRAFELMKRKSSHEFEETTDIEAILIIGGDGSVSEVVSGLYDACRDTHNPEWHNRIGDVPLCHVPGGTGNALAQSISQLSGDVCGPIDTTYNLIKGSTCALDLLEYEFADGRRLPSFLSFEWAMLADIDLGSEFMRCLGDVRFQLAAIYRIFCLKRYEGMLAYLPYTESESSLPIPSLTEALPEANGEEDASWIQVDASNFQLVVATNLSHLDANTPMVPHALPDDGAIHLVWTQGDTSFGTKFKLLNGFLQLDEGKHLDSPFIYCVKCRAFRLQPKAGSRAAIDGDEVPNEAVQATVLPSCLRVFTAPKDITGSPISQRAIPP